jgi:hypothetical protein
VADLPDQRLGLLVTGARLDAERALADGVVDLRRRDERRCPVTEVDALEPGVGKDERRVWRRRRVELGQARVPAGR